MQLTIKKSRQSDVVERLKPPVPERQKLVSSNLQTKDFLDEDLKEENRKINNRESGKDGRERKGKGKKKVAMSTRHFYKMKGERDRLRR